jgi:hypothetical protein
MAPSPDLHVGEYITCVDFIMFYQMYLNSSLNQCFSSSLGRYRFMDVMRSFCQAVGKKRVFAWLTLPLPLKRR